MDITANTTLMFAGATAAISGCVAGWQQIKGFFSRILSYAIVTINVEGTAADAMALHILKKYKRSPWGDLYFSSMSCFVRPLDREQLVAMEQVGSDAIIFWNGWFPILVWRGQAGGQEKSSRNGEERLTVKFIRKTLNVDDLIVKSVDSFNEMFSDKAENRFNVTYVVGARRSRNGGEDGGPPGMATKAASSPSDPMFYRNTLRILKWTKDDLGAKKARYERPTQKLILPPSIREAVDEARFWKMSEKWYVEHNVPWKRGWLLSGKPGTGKTSLARAIAQEMDLPIWVFDIATLSNEEFRRNWRSMMSSAPCMALLEDIDGCFNGRKNIVGNQGGGLTFDCLLNCLDGVETADGIFTVITTNHIEKVDPAIGVATGDADGSSRPGRVDRVIELTVPDKDGLFQVAKRILDDKPEGVLEEMATKAAEKGQTVAQFQEACAKIAVQEYWQRQPKLGAAEVSLTPLVPNLNFARINDSELFSRHSEGESKTRR